MAELDAYIADILANYWLKENPYCGLPDHEIGLRLAEQLGETPDAAALRESIRKLVQDGAVSAREMYDDVWVYPKRLILNPRDPLSEAEVGTYRKQLRLGGSRIELRFFHRQVLDRYRQDPRFNVVEGGAVSTLTIRDEFYLSPDTPDRDRIGIQSFGVAYGADGSQIVAVILFYLGELSLEHQQHWASWEIEDNCTVDSDFAVQAFEGVFTDRVSPFVAFVQELVEINKLCGLMGEPSLFRDTYGGKPPGIFAWITKPTLAEYNQFVQFLDRMISDNLNRDFFRGKVDLTREERGSDGKVRSKDKGTIALLEDYLTKSWSNPDPRPKCDMLATFRKIRNQRGPLAHAVISDTWDQSVVGKQKEAIIEAYCAIRTLRLLLMNHPAANAYEPPDWLQKGRIC